MYCTTEGLKQKKARTSWASRRTGKLLIMVILLFWVTSKLQTLENVRAIAIHSVPKVFWVISAVRIHTYIHLHRSRGLRSAFSVSLLTFSRDIWAPCRVCLAWTDIFNSVSFGLRWSQLHVGLKAHKLHTNCIRLPTCWKGKLLANLLRAADQLLGAAELLDRSNWSAALRCAAVMRAREHLLDRLCLCPVDLVFSYVDAISVSSASARWD